MQTKHRLFDDIAKLGISLLGLGVEIRQDIKRKVRLKLEHKAHDLGLVTREEFEVIKAMISKR